jgi:hypothetical protein
MSMSNDEYLQTQSQVMLLGALVRELPLEQFLERARRASNVGALFAPSHYIAGEEKLELVIKLAEKLRAFQAALPSEAEAKEIDERANRLRERLGV